MKSFCDYVEIIQNGKIVIPVALWEMCYRTFFSLEIPLLKR